MANVRYSQEKRIQVAEYVLDGRYSASVASKVFGIGVNTVCRWVNRLCEKRGLPCYRAERKGRRRESTRARLKELVRRNRRLEKQLAHVRETAEILKAIPVHLYSTTRFIQRLHPVHQRREQPLRPEEGAPETSQGKREEYDRVSRDDRGRFPHRNEGRGKCRIAVNDIT